MQDNQSQWVNNFWGQNDSGYHQLMQRMHDARQTCDELKQFYSERVQIEQEYSRKLMHLARRALGTNETGDMKQALESVRSTTQNAAVTHETVARQLNEQLLAPLNAFNTSMKGRSKTVEDTMVQLTKAKNSQNTSSEKARTKYVNECNRISGYQASQNLLMGKELDRNNQKLDKATYQVEGLQRQYQDSLKALAQAMETWNAEWRVSCEKLQGLEEERLTFMKSNLWAYANSLSAACVADDEACETVRLALERCEPLNDLEKFSQEHGTGSLIQDPPEFVNFLQGFSREADEDNHYHVANFNSQAIPDLGVPSPSSSRQLSPNSNMGQFSPVSSTSGSPVMNHYQAEKQSNVDFMAQSLANSGIGSTPVAVPASVKKRKSWALPFKKKQHSMEIPTTYVSALDEPSFTASNTAQQPNYTNTSNITGSGSGSGFSVVGSTRPVNTDGRRKSWAPNLAAQASDVTPANEDPLLTALERLKAPGLKARPKSAFAVTSDSSNTTTATATSAASTSTTHPYASPSPYGNGSPIKAETHHGTSKSVDVSNGRQIPHRKQVGSSLPAFTSDGRPVIKHSRAQYDYRAAIPEEVTFRKGDLLLITEMQEDGWWDCEVANAGNAYGLAPSNFLADA